MGDNQAFLSTLQTNQQRARYDGQSATSTNPFEAPPEYSDQAPLVNEQEFITGDRPKNFPPCRPCMRHNINVDIPERLRTMVRRGYFGWYFHIGLLAYNAICLTGALISGSSVLAGFFYSLLALVLGFFVSFFVYWLFYSAVKNNSAAFYMIWFILFVLQVAYELFLAIGISAYGGGGFILMISMFSGKKSIPLGVMCALNWILLAVLIIYNISLFLSARREYAALGGTRAATKEMGKGAVNTAYENRQQIKQFAVDNKDVIKQVVVENKDTIIQFAKDNKDTIVDVVVENKDTIRNVAVENKDTIWENRDMVASVFDSKK